MSKKKRPGANDKSQQYDTSLKGWVKAQAKQIVPQLLPGATFVKELDIERIKPTWRVDRVFQVRYCDELHILHIEFESGSDTEMPLRMLAYNGILCYEYKLPVISLIVYPFRTAIAVSPAEVKSGGETIHHCDFKTLPLFTLEAEQYIQEHITCMYPLLPSMQGANSEVIVRAMAELAVLYRGDETTLSQQFTWMQILLERTTMISDEEKAKIGDKLKMYDQSSVKRPQNWREEAQRATSHRTR